MNNALIWNNLNLAWVYDDLFGSVLRKTACPQRARDILHDALIRFVVSSSPNRDANPHAYLRTITNNLITDEFHLSNRFSSLEAQLEHAPHDIWHAESFSSSEYLADINQRLQYAQSIIEQLPKRCREVFWLYRIEGHTQTEIAAMLGISKNMVERHVMRAIVDLSSAKEWLLVD